MTSSSSLEGDILWSFDVTSEGEPIVILNETHDFYEKFYKSDGISPILIQAMDSMFWALANAELNSLSDLSKSNFEELRVSLSNSLRCLARELPDVR